MIARVQTANPAPATILRGQFPCFVGHPLRRERHEEKEDLRVHVRVAERPSGPVVLHLSDDLVHFRLAEAERIGVESRESLVDGDAAITIPARIRLQQSRRRLSPSTTIMESGPRRACPLGLPAATKLSSG